MHSVWQQSWTEIILNYGGLQESVCYINLVSLLPAWNDDSKERNYMIRSLFDSDFEAQESVWLRHAKKRYNMHCALSVKDLSSTHITVVSSYRKITQKALCSFLVRYEANFETQVSTLILCPTNQTYTLCVVIYIDFEPQVSEWLHYTKERNYRLCDQLTRKTRMLIKVITVVDVRAHLFQSQYCLVCIFFVLDIRLKVRHLYLPISLQSLCHGHCAEVATMMKNVLCLLAWLRRSNFWCVHFASSKATCDQNVHFFGLLISSRYGRQNTYSCSQKSKCWCAYFLACLSCLYDQMHHKNGIRGQVLKADFLVLMSFIRFRFSVWSLLP